MKVSNRKKLSFLGILCLSALIYFEMNHAILRRRFSLLYKKSELLADSQIPFVPDDWNRLESCFKHGSNGFPLRQRMLNDLITNVLPGMSCDEVDKILDNTNTRKDMRRDTFWQDGKEDTKQEAENIECFFDELEWDRLYPIGDQMQPRRLDLFPEVKESRLDYLILRFDDHGKFESWCVVYDNWWPWVVESEGNAIYSRSR